MPTTVTTADLLDEYGSALRGSWGDIDGRSEKLKLRYLASAVRAYGATPLPPSEAHRLRFELDVCPYGRGHWTEFCSDYECGADE